MSSIVDFSSLQSAVANWMMRSGNADFVGNVPDFISFAEGMMSFGYDDGALRIPALRTSAMEIISTTFTVLASTQTVTLPGDFLEMRRLYLTHSPKNIKLTYVTPNQMDATLPNANADPQMFYTLMGGAIVLGAPVATTQTLVGGYYQRIPALNSSNTLTNWLLAAHPQLYLAGAQMQASLFLGNDSDAGKWGRIFNGLVRAFEGQDMEGRHSGDVLRMQTDVGGP